MTRAWIDLVAALADRIGLPQLVLAVLLAALVSSLLWYFWPSWLPRRWPRWRLPRFHRRTREGEAEAWTVEEDEGSEEPGPPHDHLPDRPVEAFLARADRYAAEGKFDLAVRERLRAIVRRLVDHAVITNVPGWTVTELADAASQALPAVGGALASASGIFSGIWYGQMPAGRGDDLRMRGLVSEVDAALTAPPVTGLVPDPGPVGVDPAVGVAPAVGVDPAVAPARAAGSTGEGR